MLLQLPRLILVRTRSLHNTMAKRRIETFCLLIAFSSLLLLPKTEAIIPVTISPIGPIILKGTPIQLTCSPLPGSQHTAHDLMWYYNGETLSKETYKVQDDGVGLLVIDPAEIGHSGTYSCGVAGDGAENVAKTTVTVGTRPDAELSCKSTNHLRVVCSWSDIFSNLPSKAIFSWKPHYEVGDDKYEVCKQTEEDVFDDGGCICSDTHTCYFPQSHGSLHFMRLKLSNALGNNTIVIVFNPDDETVPNKPRNVTATALQTESESESVLVKWLDPVDWHSDLYHLFYKVEYREELTEIWIESMENRWVMARKQVEVKDLQPFTTYLFRVACLSEYADPESYEDPDSPWSAWSDVAMATTYQYGQPQFTYQPEDTDVRVGESVVLPCRASGYPMPMIHWTRSDKTLPERERYSISSSGSLHISDVQRIDHGQYKCEAVNSVGTISATAYLIILSQPQFTYQPEDTEVTEGESVVLLCNASGYPRPVIRWTRHNQSLSDDERYNISPSGSLHISDVQRIDHGQYKCEAFNSEGTISATGHLIIFSQPQFTYQPEDMEVRVGENMVLPCRVTGYPEPTIRWTRHNQNLPEDERYNISQSGSLNILDVQQLDNGHYKCEAVNNVGTISATAQLIILKTNKKIDPVAAIPITVGAAILLIVCGLMGRLLYRKVRRTGFFDPVARVKLPDDSEETNSAVLHTRERQVQENSEVYDDLVTKLLDEPIPGQADRDIQSKSLSGKSRSGTLYIRHDGMDAENSSETIEDVADWIGYDNEDIGSLDAMNPFQFLEFISTIGQDSTDQNNNDDDETIRLS